MEDLKKDVGRITFPKIEQKLTRPDQEVSTWKTSPEVQAKVASNKIKNFFPSLEDWERKAFEDRIKNRIASGPAWTVSVDGNNDEVKNLVATKRHGHPDPKTAAEHEGFHYLVNHISSVANVNPEEIYNKFNNLIHPAVKQPLVDALKVHRGYEIPDRELVAGLRDMLVNKDWRDKVLSSVAPESHNDVTTEGKKSFSKIKEAAKAMTISDLKKAENEEFDKRQKDKKYPKVIFDGGSMKEQEKPQEQKMEELHKEDEKQLKKLLESAMTVAKHKLGRPPALEDLLGMFTGEEKADVANEQDAAQAPASEPVDLPPSAPKILSMKVVYGMSGDGESRKPDKSKILFYKTDDNNWYDTGKQEWLASSPSHGAHLPERDMMFDEKDIVAAIAHGVMDEHDYHALDSAGMLSDLPKQLWSRVSKLKSLHEQLEKSEVGEEMVSPEESPEAPETHEETDQSEIENILQGAGEVGEIEDIPPGDDLVAEIMKASFEAARSGLEEQIEAVVLKVLREKGFDL